MSIYTKTGDNGTTALFGGKRVLKNDIHVDAYGSIDELNSWIGLIRTNLSTPDVQEFLGYIQKDLFIIGGSIAGWSTDLTVLHTRINQMEARIDQMEKQLPQLTQFILPGGSELGAFIHIARSVARRMERLTVTLSQKEHVESVILKYINRLSDMLFMLARFVNSIHQTPEVTWSGIGKTAKT